MTPPIDITEINSLEDAQKALQIGKISTERAEFIAQALLLIKAIPEKKESNHEHLLNKPNMTAKDKANMQKSIDFLVDNKIATSENLKKLEAINYGSNYIEIGGVKRARENLKAKPDNKNIFKHGDEVYFKFYVLEEQNKLLAKQGMEIPGKDSFITSMKALPGRYYGDTSPYISGSILGNILDLSIIGSCAGDGTLIEVNRYGRLWSSSSSGTVERHSWIQLARSFTVCEGHGEVQPIGQGDPLAVRPVFM